MSQENIEIVRRGWEAWTRDDFDTWLSTLDPAVEWHTALERLVDGMESFYRGTEGMRELWAAYRTELADFRIEAEELRDVGMTAFLDSVIFGGAARRAGSSLTRL